MAIPGLSFGGDQASAGGGTINNGSAGSGGFPFSAPSSNPGLLVVGGLAVLYFVLFRKKGR